MMVGIKKKNRDLPPYMARRTYTNKKGEVWVGYYYTPPRVRKRQKDRHPAGFRSGGSQTEVGRTGRTAIRCRKLLIRNPGQIFHLGKNTGRIRIVRKNTTRLRKLLEIPGTGFRESRYRQNETGIPHAVLSRTLVEIPCQT